MMCLGGLAIMATSCDVLQEPEGDLTRFTLHLDFETEFRRMEYNLDDTRHDDRSRVYVNELDHGVISYTLRAYPLFKGEVVKNIYFEYKFMRDITDGYDCDYTFDIDGGNYRFMLFAQLAESPNGPFYYDDSDFWDIKLQGEYVGDTNYRDAFRGLIDVNAGSSYSATMTMTRPLGKYEFISTDLPSFIDREAMRRTAVYGTRDTRVPLEDYSVIFKYVGFMPSAYNLPEDRTVDSMTDVEFESTISQLNNDEAILGFDYVFAGPEETYVTLQVSIYDNISGQRLTVSDNARIPVKRSYDTVVFGTFMYGNEDGGIIIDPGYEGDLNIFFDGTKKDK